MEKIKILIDQSFKIAYNPRDNPHIVISQSWFSSKLHTTAKVQKRAAKW